MRGLAALAACLLAAACAGGPGGLSVPPVEVAGARGAPRPLPASLSLPSGQGPFPVVILLHGCGGLSPSLGTWAGRLNGWGYATVTVDSFTPRGVTSVCAPANQPLVTPADRAGDVISTAVFLRTRPEIDPNRIGVLGLSHGGATAAWVTQARFEKAFPGLLHASVDYYGPCRSAETHGTVPLLALAGEADDWGNSARVCRAFGAKLRPDQPFEIHTYPDTVHAFDDPMTTMRRNEGHMMGYNHDAAVDSYERVRVFLARWLGQR
jgi:dienelactone hydrolase